MSKAGAQQLLPLPDLRTLTAGLKAVFGMHGSRDEPLLCLSGGLTLVRVRTRARS